MGLVMFLMVIAIGAVFGQGAAIGLMVGVIGSYVAFLLIGMNAPPTSEKPKEYTEPYDCHLPPSKQKNFYVLD